MCCIVVSLSKERRTSYLDSRQVSKTDVYPYQTKKFSNIEHRTEVIIKEKSTLTSY